MRQGAPRDRQVRWVRELWRWVRTNTFTPVWATGSWRQPAMGYLIAILAEVMAALVSPALSLLFPHLLPPAIIVLPVLVLVALNWGMGPSIVAAVTGAAALGGFALPGGSPGPVSVLARLVLFLVVALTVSIAASRMDRARRDAQAFAGQLDAIFEAIADGVAVHGPDGRIQRVNLALRGLLGLDSQAGTATSVLQAHASEMVPVDTAGHGPTPHDWPIAAILRGEVLAGATAADIAIGSRDGRHVQVSVSGAPVRDRQDRVVGGVLVLRDVTERVAALHREQAARAQAEAAVRMRDAFLIAASHDLRTPLTGILGRADLLQLQLDGAGALDKCRLGAQVRALRLDALRMARTIEDLTDIAQLQMGQRPSLQLEEVEVGTLVRAVAAMVTAASRPGAAEIVLDAPDHAVVLQGDRARLERVVQNILGNAIKYSPEAARVAVTVRAQEDWITITVQDGGVGIPAADLPQVFTAFYRGSTAGGMAGIGIGLTSARTIVEQHRGRITVESAVGEGTTVRVVLPRHLPPSDGEGQVTPRLDTRAVSDIDGAGAKGQERDDAGYGAGGGR